MSQHDLTIVARDLAPTEAHLLAANLRAAGLIAFTSDAELTRVHSLWSIAIGGAKVCVPLHQVQETKSVMLALQRGDYALPDDFDGQTSSS